MPRRQKIDGRKLPSSEPVKEYKVRHASTLLAFEAVVEAAEKAEEVL